jgi:hypothetical protein
VLQKSFDECKIKVFRSFFMPKCKGVRNWIFFPFLFLFSSQIKKSTQIFTISRWKFFILFYGYMNLCTHRESWESIKCASKKILLPFMLLLAIAKKYVYVNSQQKQLINNLQCEFSSRIYFFFCSSQTVLNVMLSRTRFRKN